MKKKWLAGMLCIGVLMTAVGCSLQTETPVSSEETEETTTLSGDSRENVTERVTEESTEERDYYGELIEAARTCHVEKDEEVLENYDFSSVLMTSGDYEVLGYLIEDLDGDGIDELIFGGNVTEPDAAWDGIIYDIYTISDGELIHVLDGWERNRYFLCENGMIANEGSSGAADSNYTYFTFEKSELHLVESVIYDGMKDAENPWFYSTESEYDAENADPISEEQANEIMGKYVYQRPIFIPFMSEQPVPESVIPVTSAVLEDSDDQGVSLYDVMDRILVNQGLNNSLEYENGLEDVLKDTIVKLCTSESGQYTAFGFISPEYGRSGILINNILDGQDNWNYFEEPWSYSSAIPALEEQGEYKVLFTYSRNNGTKEELREMYFDTYDTGTMSVREVVDR